MHKQKPSVSLSQEQLLQQLQLETCYKEANQEINNDFDATTPDGIEDNEV